MDLALLVERLGGAIVATHSQSGIMGHHMARILKERGHLDAQVYNPVDTTVGGVHAISVILGEPENYNLPPAPEVPTAYLKSAWTSALVSATVLFGAICAAFALQ